MHWGKSNLPGVASNADDTDGAAGNTDNRSDVADIDVQEAEKLGNGGVLGRSSAVAALNWACVALAGGNGRTSCGGSKGGGSSSDCEESKSSELHVWMFGLTGSVELFCLSEDEAIVSRPLYVLKILFGNVSEWDGTFVLGAEYVDGHHVVGNVYDFSS